MNTLSGERDCAIALQEKFIEGMMCRHDVIESGNGLKASHQQQLLEGKNTRKVSVSQI
jgi:hypothetical protein